MIPQVTGNAVVSSGTLESSHFGISMADAAHLMEVLRSTLYTDKVLAVIREYGSNAWDAHRMVQKSELPIRVHVPTAENRKLVIRDFGPGISPEDMLRIFTQYGASTKRDSNQAVGMLGIGSKAGFSYAESFEVTSFYAGKKRTYVCALDQSNRGLLNLLHETETEESGFEVTIAVKSSDVWSFQQRATELFKHFVPRPEINLHLPEPRLGVGDTKSGAVFVSTGNTEWTAVMGCAPYRLNLQQVDGVPEFLKQGTSGVLYFDIGDVAVSASREELRYSDKTKKAVIEKLDCLFDEFSAWLLRELENPELSAWEKRWKVVAAAAVLPSVKSLPSVAEFFHRTVAVLPDDEFDVHVVESHRGKLVARKVSSFHVESHSLFVVGSLTDYVKSCRKTSHLLLSPRVENADAEAFLLRKKLAGAPVVSIDELLATVVVPVKPRKKYASQKVKCFRLGGAYRGKPEDWVPAEGLPEGAFLAVYLERYKNEVLTGVESWMALAAHLGLRVPAVYGVPKARFAAAVKKAGDMAIPVGDWFVHGPGHG